jgi:hypothetical protein
MALINLDYIKKLYTEARLRHHVVSTYSFRPKSEMDKEVDDAMIISFFRMYHQAHSLLDKLTDLHTACSDLSKGDIQKYIDQHLRDVGDAEPYDPFFEIEYNFDGQTVYDLPETIETYSELYQMSLQYARIREVSDQALDKLFDGKLQWQLPVHEDGETIYVPQKDLPKDYVEEFRINQQINNIEIEYALDRYNQFYQACIESIRSNRATGDYQRCAQEILSLYAPTSRA